MRFLHVNEKEKNLHAGHRARLKARFLREGLDNFEEHNIVELLLFFGVPFKDTNDIAHRLLWRFGGIRQMFDAPYEQLCEVEGVGENVATLIKLVPQLCRIYIKEGNDAEKYDNVDKLGRMLAARYIGVDRETVYLTLLDNSFRLISIDKIFEGSVNSASVSTRMIAELSLKNNASMAVLSHNHPRGIAVPSMDDIETTSRLVHLFDSIGVPMLEHLLVAGGSYTPILYNQFGERRVLPDASLLSARIDLRAFYERRD